MDNQTNVDQVVESAEKQVAPWMQTAIAALTSYIDAGSIVAGGLALAHFWKEKFGMNELDEGLIVAFSPNAFAAAIGALVGGMICDKLGRKFVYTYDLVLYIIGMLFVIFAPNFYVLFSAYMVVGLAVGADVVASWTLIAEQAPAENRARHCGAAQLAWAIGPAVVFIIAYCVGTTSPMVHQIVLGHLVVVALITWMLRLQMPESKNWREARDREKKMIAEGKIEKVRFSTFLRGINLRTILFLCGIYVIWNLCAGTMGFLLPTIHKEVCGLGEQASTALMALLFSVSAFSTLFVFMSWGDRLSRRGIYCVIAFLFVVAWGIFLLPESVLKAYPILLMTLFSVLVGINNGSGQQAFYQLWCSELFPARYRATAQGITFFATRISCGIWTFTIPFFIAKDSFATAALFMVFFATFSMLVGTLFAPKTSGKTLQQIEKERYGDSA
ncbi:MAG: MFS transporter [Planctomycetia bacterium]|nr:MFS transporter [Planctomycetia bacterium]